MIAGLTALVEQVIKIKVKLFLIIVIIIVPIDGDLIISERFQRLLSLRLNKRLLFNIDAFV